MKDAKMNENIDVEEETETVMGTGTRGGCSHEAEDQC